MDNDSVATAKITVKHKIVETSVVVLDNASQTVKAGDSIKPILFKYENIDSIAVVGVPKGTIRWIRDIGAQTFTLAGAVDESLADGEYTVTVEVFGADNDSAATAKIVVNHLPVETSVEVVSNDSQVVTAGDSIKPIVFKYANMDSVAVLGLPVGSIDLLKEQG